MFYVIPPRAEPEERRAIAIDALDSVRAVAPELRAKPMRALEGHLRSPTLRKHLSIGTVGDVLRIGAERLMTLPETGPATVVALANAIASAAQVDPETLIVRVDMPGHWRERIVQGMWDGMVLARRTVAEDRLWIEDPWVLMRPEIVDGRVVQLRDDAETELYNASRAPRHGFPEDACDLPELERVIGIGEPRWLSDEGIALALRTHGRIAYLSRRLKRAPGNR